MLFFGSVFMYVVSFISGSDLYVRPVDLDHTVVMGVRFLDFLLHAMDQFFFRNGNIVRDDHIEDEIGVAFAGDHAEIVDRDPWIDAFGDFLCLVLKTHEVFVFRVDRIHMNDRFAV